MSLRIASITSKRKSYELFCNLDVCFIFLVLFCMHEVHSTCFHLASLLTSGILNFSSGRTETFPNRVLEFLHAFLKNFLIFKASMFVSVRVKDGDSTILPWTIITHVTYTVMSYVLFSFDWVKVTKTYYDICNVDVHLGLCTHWRIRIFQHVNEQVKWMYLSTKWRSHRSINE